MCIRGSCPAQRRLKRMQSVLEWFGKPRDLAYILPWVLSKEQILRQRQEQKSEADWFSSQATLKRTARLNNV